MGPNKKFYEYIDQYKIMHKERGYTGSVGISPTYRNKEQLKEAIDMYSIQTMLDYGCASGVQYTKGKLDEYLGVDVKLYDPAVDQYSEDPTGTYDAVICVDVLEHVHEEHLDYVLQRIFSYADKMVWLKIGLAPAVAILPNGENAHVTVHNIQWWIDKIKPFNKKDLPLFINKFWV